jgi:hypothetical protein
MRVQLVQAVAFYVFIQCSATLYVVIYLVMDTTYGAKAEFMLTTPRPTKKQWRRRKTQAAKISKQPVR